MSFKNIFCQDKGISLLQRAFAAERVPHAFIFAGVEGVGKFKVAIEWAKLLLCADPVIEKNRPESVDSCGLCESCRAFDSGAHPDFSHIYKELLEFTKDNKDKKTPTELSIHVIREFLVDKVAARPSLSKRKVFVVSEAEKLNNSSQNSLLKILEEPPGDCCIILLCTRLEKLLQTTRSRCRIVRFGPIDEGIIVEKLPAMGIDKKRSLYFARLSQGSLGLARRWAELEAADGGIFETKKQVVASITELKYTEIPELAADLVARSKAISEAWAQADKKASKKDIGRAASKSVVRMVISAIYDAMNHTVRPENEIINLDQKQNIDKLARKFGPNELAQRIVDCFEILRYIEAGVNEKLVFEQLLFNLASSDRMAV
ncbi:MAG: DNA polymerase III subunit [Planctomycetota bacterium]|jgi:DNA polymerase III gamma/tau subunit